MKTYIEYLQLCSKLNSQPQSLFSNTTASFYCYRASSAVFYRLLFLHCVYDAIHQGHDCAFNYVLNFIYYKVHALWEELRFHCMPAHAITIQFFI